jgi:hypothetical protein
MGKGFGFRFEGESYLLPTMPVDVRARLVRQFGIGESV